MLFAIFSKDWPYIVCAILILAITAFKVEASEDRRVCDYKVLYNYNYVVGYVGYSELEENVIKYLKRGYVLGAFSCTRLGCKQVVIKYCD